MPSDLMGGLFALGGTIVGGAITYFGQRASLRRTEQRDASALAGALGAEISAYLNLMERRDHVSNAKRLAELIRTGHKKQIRGFLDADSKPLDEFPYFKSQMGKIGLLGSELCLEVAKYYALLAGVQTTVISAEKGKYDGLDHATMASIVDHEVALWQEALEIGKGLVPKLMKLSIKN